MSTSAPNSSAASSSSAVPNSSAAASTAASASEAATNTAATSTAAAAALNSQFAALDGCLSGVRVLNFAVNVPGPIAAQRLGLLGAEVTKVEPPVGDPLAQYARPWYDSLAAGQKVIQLDLKAADAAEQLDALLRETDIVITSFRPAALERMGLANLPERYPHLIQVDIVGDLEAPEVPGHDLTYQAGAGTLTPPQMPTVLLGDFLGAEHATTAALAMLVGRGTAGKTESANAAAAQRHCQIGLKQAGLTAAAALQVGITAPTGLLGGALWTYGIYESSDGHVAVAALEPHFAKQLVQATGASDGASLSEFLQTRSTADIVQWAEANALPIAAVS